MDVQRILYGNRYPGYDPVTRKSVPVGEGVSVQVGGRWYVYEKKPDRWPNWLMEAVERDKKGKPSSPPTGGEAPAAPVGGGKFLHADGTLDFPYDPAALPIIKAAPGARWDGARRKWTLSVSLRDLPRTLEVAKRIGAEVDKKLLGTGIAGTAGLSGAAIDTVATGGGGAYLSTIVTRAVSARSAEGWRPFPHQLQAVEFLTRHSFPITGRRECALLADQMGLGKTACVLLALPANARVILVVPAVVRLNWLVEARRWRPDLQATVLMGKGSFKWPAPGQIGILGYDTLPKFGKPTAESNWMGVPGDASAKVASAAAGPDGAAVRDVILVADEAHKLKNPGTQRHRSFNGLSRLAGTTWLLTGTPLANRPPDLYWTLASGGCAGGAFGWGRKGWERFKVLFNARDVPAYRGGPIITEWGHPQPEVADLLRRIMLRRTKAEVLPNLPEKRYEWITVPLTDKALGRELDEIQAWMEREGRGRGEDGEGRALLPPFEKMSRVREQLAASRVNALEELVEEYEEADKPVVVASAHRAPLLHLAKREGWAAIVGGTPDAERQRLIEAFQRGALKGLAIAIEAAGVGITLTAADTMIFVDLAWRPDQNSQAEDRIHRIGAKTGEGSAVLYRILVSDHPLDKHVSAILASKRAVVEAAVERVMTYTPPVAPPVGAARDMQAYWRDIARAIAAAKAGKAREKLVKKLGTMAGMEDLASAASGKRPLPSYPPQVVMAMQQALQGLASVCDYAKEKDWCGFNKPDAATGHSLAMVGLGDPVAQHVAWGVLRKYKDQLGGEGGLWGTIYGGGRQGGLFGR